MEVANIWNALTRVSPRSRIVRAFALLLAALLSQCTSVELPTRVAFTLDAPAELRSRIALVDLALYADISSEAWRLRTRDQLKPDGPNAWPLHWSIVRSSPRDQRYSLEARALDDKGNPLTELRAVGEFRSEETVRLSLRFDASCMQPCDQGQTCSQGRCVAAEEVVKTAIEQPPAGGTAGAGRDAPAPSRAATSCSDASACQAVCPATQGMCDPLVDCHLESGQPRCGGCPEGFVGDGATGCRAVLSDLTVEGATLDPAFSSEHTDYTLKIGLLKSQWQLIPSAGRDAVVRVNGQDLATGGSISAQQLPAAQEVFVIDVAVPKHEGTQYRITLKMQGGQRDVIKAAPPVQNARFAHRIAVDGDTLVSSASGDASSALGVNPANAGSGGADNSGALHVFKRQGSRWEQTDYIKASDASANAEFGNSVALQGDTLVVGAWRESDSGAAYVFVREAGQWREQSKLVPAERQNGSNYGQRVAVQGNTLVVGAGGYDVAANDTGAVFVYKRKSAGAPFEYMQTVSPAELKGYVWFGSSVELSEDYLVAGATGEGSGTLGGGAAYVFRSDSFELIDVLKPSAAAAAGFFGEHAAIAGDTIAVSSFNNNAGLTNGVVYVYERGADGKFEQKTELQASNASGGDHFGSALAMNPSYLLVGAMQESSGARGINGTLSAPEINHSGAAYLFARTSQGFIQVAHIKVDEPQPDAQLGNDVALSGADIFVATENDTRAAAKSGAIYLFR